MVGQYDVFFYMHYEKLRKLVTSALFLDINFKLRGNHSRNWHKNKNHHYKFIQSTAVIRKRIFILLCFYNKNNILIILDKY